MSLSPNEQPQVDLGFARLDLDRQKRCGFPEVIYGEGKTVEGLIQIVHALASAHQHCLVTRVTEKQAELLSSTFPQAEHNRTARTFWLPYGEAPRHSGRIAIVTAGTADVPVAEEAAATTRAFGFETDLIVDVGVAGLHRLIAQLDRIRQADILIVVAGMEAALPSVVGGLVAVPVIAVPTSVGYGSHFQGLTALLGMLNSCAANVCVVNIDAGFKAGYVAALMLHSAQRKASA